MKISYHNCNIELNPELEQLRSKSKITTPQGLKEETLVATTPNPVSELDQHQLNQK